MSTVVAVVSVFRAPDDLPPRLVALADQVRAVVVVDDGSDSLGAVAEHPSIIKVSLSENRGIAHALNVGVERARALGATHVLTLDQDSTAPTGFVERMLEVLARAEAAGVAVAAVVPELVGEQRVMRIADEPWAFDPIQAGQLVPM